MKTVINFFRLGLVAAFLVATVAVAQPAAEKAKPEAKAKPYPLDTCIVSDEKLGADPAMKTFTFTHAGQEIKLCCKSCQKTFTKDPAKYLKKIADAEKAKKPAAKK
jgi:hypothetical protein